MTAIAAQSLNPRPDFQRRMVWTNDDKLNFISTVLRGFPFPEIYVCAGSLNSETGEASEFLVDGQQRVTTLYQYFKGIEPLRVGKNIKPYVQLTEQEKQDFLQYEVVVRDLGRHPLNEIREIFEIINSANYALNSIEVKNARYAGDFKKFCEEVAERQEWKDWKIFKLNDVRRMQDLRYCLVLVATMLSTYFNRDERIEEFLKQYNDVFPPKEKLRKDINQCFSFIADLNLPTDSRAFRKTDIFSILVELHRAFFLRNVVLDVVATRERLLSFFEKVDLVPMRALTGDDKMAVIYYRSTLRAAIDRINRYSRGEILQSVLDPSYVPKMRFAEISEDEESSQISVQLTLEEGDY